MAIKKTSYISLFLLHLIASISSQDICSFNAACPNQNEPSIRFPFRLRNLQRRRCGYDRAFDLACDNLGSTVIQLQNSGSFSVQQIDYSLQQIWLNDPNNCLPQRLLSLNLTGSPFTGVNVQDFSLYNCSSNFRSSRFNPVSCLSNSNYTVFATSSPRASIILRGSCNLIGTVLVPVQGLFIEEVYSSDLSNDIRLAWTDPECGRCESEGGRCGWKSNSNTDIQCRRKKGAGLSRAAQYAISFGVGVPAVLLIGGLVCIICDRLKTHGYRRRRSATVEHALSMAPLPPPPRIIMGLDDPTIESYPKTVLGESKRLPKAGDNICSICLSEYKPNNILRTIPTCHHTFHADCIDEWLRLNASCPVCRKSPLLLQQSL